MCMKEDDVACKIGKIGDSHLFPVEKVQAGQVSAALWKNEITTNGHKAIILKAYVQRRYKDKDGTWK